MKKFWWILAAAALIGLFYYLFLRPYEFLVTLNANTHPGDVIQTVRIWNRSMKDSEIVRVDSLDGLTQTILIDGRSYVYDWRFTMRNDSATRIAVRVSEPERRLVNKILVPFTTPPIEKDASELMHAFHAVLKEHLEITGVRLLGEAQLDSSFCICSTLETRQIEKANGMMKIFPALTDFITVMGLKPKGYPSVRVTQWNHSAGDLKFDFCFPIVKMESLPTTELFSYKSFAATRALLAEYNGNYITSDRAWYVLMQKASEGGYKVKGLPVEFFQNNPNLGSNESSWKAEIYLPVE